MRQYDRMVMGWSRKSLLLFEVVTNDDSTAFGPRIEVRATSSSGGDATSTADRTPVPAQQLANKICVK
jgi:hypothetical protein